MNISLYNVTSEGLNQCRFPIFIGISVGVKPMSEGDALAYLKWAEAHTSDVVQILIADEIDLDPI